MKEQTEGMTDTQFLEWLYDRMRLFYFEDADKPYMARLRRMIDESKTCDLSRYRAAVMGLGVEAGIIGNAKQPANQAIGEEYYIEIIREAELRMRKLSAHYERLLNKINREAMQKNA